MTVGLARLRHFSKFRGPWTWHHFTPAELADHETGELVVVPTFLDWLEFIRVVFNRPMIINDATRSAHRQRQKSGRETGSHVDGMAVDVRVHGEDAHDLAKIALAHGALGLGVYQAGDRSIDRRFLHLDLWTKAPVGLRPRLWSG